MGFAIFWTVGIIVAGLAFGWKVAFLVWASPLIIAGVAWLAHVVIHAIDR